MRADERAATVAVTGATAVAWSDALVTGHSGLDATHRSFVDVANELVAAGDADLLVRLRAFEAPRRRTSARKTP